jgi:hypothetical protein
LSLLLVILRSSLDSRRRLDGRENSLQLLVFLVVVLDFVTFIVGYFCGPPALSRSSTVEVVGLVRRRGGIRQDFFV